MFAEYLAIGIVMLAWGGYPLLSRSAGVPGPAGALMLTLFALLPIGCAFFWQGDNLRLTGQQFLKLALGGCCMGVGATAFNFVANSRKLEASVSLPIANASTIIGSVVGALLVFSEPITLKKALGVALIVGGIGVLKPS